MPFNIRIVHVHEDHFLFKRIIQQNEENQNLLFTIIQKLNKMEQNQERFDAFLQKISGGIDEATGELEHIRTDLTSLIGIVKGKGLNEDQENLFLEKAEGVVQKWDNFSQALRSLKDIHAPETDPIPPAEPTEPSEPTEPAPPIEQPTDPEQPSEPTETEEPNPNNQ